MFVYGPQDESIFFYHSPVRKNPKVNFQVGKNAKEQKSITKTEIPNPTAQPERIPSPAPTGKNPQTH
jgi:hypothetical protein